MFEQELEMEQKEGRGFGPIIIIVLMIVALVGGVGYMVVQSTRTLKPAEASSVIEAGIKAQSPAVVKFHTGHITPSMSDSPDHPQYTLLTNLGLMTFKKDKKTTAADVALTPEGESKIGAVPGLEKKSEADGQVAYVVPLATRKFVRIENITKLGTGRFQVEYSWQWQPNQLGDLFDATGPAVQKFNAWDRSQLIDKFGSDFYHGEPTKTTVVVTRGDGGWTLSKP